MSQPHISMKALAQFMGQNSFKQRKTVFNYKHPDPEGLAQAKYYDPTLRAILSYYKSENDRNILLSALMKLTTEIATVTDKGIRQKLNSNIKALRAFFNAQDLVQRKFSEFEGFKGHLEISGVSVSVFADLRAKETKSRGNPKIRVVKFIPTVESLDKSTLDTMNQLMLMYAQQESLNIPCEAFEIVEIHKDSAHRGAKIKTRLTKNIEAACSTYADIWNSIA